MPEAQQGMDVARISTLLADLPDSVPAFTFNRYCSSRLQSIAIAANEIAKENMQVAFPGGVESMSMIPMGGNNISFSSDIFAKDENIAIAYGIGLTAEHVAKNGIFLEPQRMNALASHQKALNAIDQGNFKDEIMPIEVHHRKPSIEDNSIVDHKIIIDTDKGPRHDTSLEAFAAQSLAVINKLQLNQAKYQSLW